MNKISKMLGTCALAVAMPFAAQATPAIDVAPANGTVASVVETSSTDGIWSIFGAIRTAIFGAEETEPIVEAHPVAHDAAGPCPSGEVVCSADHHLAELGVQMRPEIQKYVQHFKQGSGSKTTRQSIERSEGERDEAKQIFAEEGVPANLVWLAMVESEWKPQAVSPVGAAGVWQFMPATARDFGMRVGGGVDERLDFAKSTRASAKYLRQLANRYDGNWELALAAYNYGQGNVDKAVRKAGQENFWVLAESNLLPKETEEYVPKVLAASVVGVEAEEVEATTEGADVSEAR